MIIGIDASRANHSQKTGVEWYAWHLIEELKKIIPQTHEVRLYTDVPLSGALANLPTHWHEVVLSWPPKKMWTQVRLSWEMFRRPPDVLFVPAHVLPLVHPAHAVMTIHDLAGAAFPKAYSRFERWYSTAMPRRALRNSAHVIVPSHAVKNEVMQMFPDVARADCVHVIHHGIREDFLSTISGEEVAEVCIRYNLSDPFFLYTGRLEEKKNIVTLIEAFNRFRASSTQVFQLVLVGKPGFGYEAVVRAIADSPYKQDIRELGWVETETLVALFRAARAFVYPSWYEGFGLPLLEAFASGTPVIGSTTPALQEIGGDAYVAVPPEDTAGLVAALTRIATDDAFVQELVLRAVPKTRDYRFKKTAEETFSVLSLSEKS